MANELAVIPKSLMTRIGGMGQRIGEGTSKMSPDVIKALLKKILAQGKQKALPLLDEAGGVAAGAAKTAGKFGKYLKHGGNILSGAILANAIRETVRDSGTATAIEGMNPASPRRLLEGLRNEEMLQARQSRLAQTDPVAMMMLKRLLAGKQMPPQLAAGEIMIGQAMEGPDASDADVQKFLAAMG